MPEPFRNTPESFDWTLFSKDPNLAMCLVDNTGAITFWSLGSERTFGFTAAEALKQPHLFLHAEPCTKPDSAVFPSQETTCALRHRSGDIIHANVMMHPIPDGSGAFLKTFRVLPCQPSVEAHTLRLEALNKALAAHLESRNWREAAAIILRYSLERTQSTYGFIGVVVDKDVLRILAHEGIEWHASEGRAFYEAAIATYRQKGYLEFKSLANLFGRVITSVKPVISNDVGNDPRAAKSLPPGHPPLYSFLGVPLLQRNEVIGEIGVANRPGGYSEKELDDLSELSAMTAALFNGYRLNERQKALETQLRHMKVFEAFGQVAGGVAHDFNNLASVLDNVTEFIQEKVGSDSILKEELDLLQQTSHQMSLLAKHLMSFKRSEHVKSTPIDVGSVIRESAKLFRHILGPAIQFELRVPDEPHFVLMNRAELEQILMNLVLNARDAITGAGQVTVLLTHVFLNEHAVLMRPDLQPGDFVVLAISDSGQGMSDEVKARIFEPFFTTKAPGKGTGLGLSTLFRIVKSARGSVDVDSTAGRGTTIKIYLPRMSAPSAATPPSSTLLLIEDNDLFRETLKRSLENMNYSVITAESRDAALAALENTSVNAVIMDWDMPGLSVAEFLSQAQLPDCYIVISGDEGARASAAEKGLSRFLAKPFKVSDLDQLIKECISQ